MPPVKRKHKTLSIKDKLDIIDKLEKGYSGTSLASEYGVGKATISDFKRQKEQLREYARKHLPHDLNLKSRAVIAKTMKTSKYKALDEAVFKWHGQMAASGVNARGVEILGAAKELAEELGIQDFNASEGWLWRFRRRHALGNRVVRGEAASAPLDEVNPFRDMITKIIDDEGLIKAQIYNFDETGLFWRSLPTNTQANIHEKTQKGRKLDKSRISALLGANADGTHRLKPVIVGKSAKPRVLKDCMSDLPCHYYSSRNAWFTSDIFNQVFKKAIVPAIEKFQIETLHISPDRVRAIILLDNAPAHPHGCLEALGGRIRVLFLPPNTTSIIQPMDQGVIQATKMRYKRLFLKDVLVVRGGGSEDVDGEDSRGIRTLQNLKAYNLKSAIYNFTNAWQALSQSTLENAWNALLRGQEDVAADFGGFDVKEFREVLIAAGENGPTEDDVEQWLAEDEGDPGYELLSNREIAASVIADDREEEKEEEDVEEDRDDRISLATAREACDRLTRFIDQRGKQFSSHYLHVRALRTSVISSQYQSLAQIKIDSFFHPRTPSSRGSSVEPSATPSPVPSTSGVTTFRPLFPSAQSDSESE